MLILYFNIIGCLWELLHVLQEFVIVIKNRVVKEGQDESTVGGEESTVAGGLMVCSRS